MSRECGTNKEMILRPATPDDADQIARVIADSWEWAYAEIVPEDVMMSITDRLNTANLIRETWNPAKACVVADVNGVVIGYASERVPPSLANYDAEIASLYVVPSESRFGVGQMLVATMCEKFAERGCESLCIHTLRDNRVGRRFYEKIGGVVVEEATWRDLPSIWYGWAELPQLTFAEQPQ